jgi:hypothetical protein
MNLGIPKKWGMSRSLENTLLFNENHGSINYFLHDENSLIEPECGFQAV